MQPAQTARLTALSVCACALLAASCSETPTDPAARTLALVEQWVEGTYNNVAQFEADMAADLPPEQTHRPMHQLFARVDAPLLEGHIVFQQSSINGTEDPATIVRHGLLQFFPDPDSDALIQRELYFKEADAFKNLHRNPERLADISLDDMTWDAGCDFYLRTNEAGDMVSGPLREGACVRFNPGLQKNMYADDRVEITATDYRFKGVYKDDTGAVVWGTSSAELNTLVRQAP